MRPLDGMDAAARRRTVLLVAAGVLLVACAAIWVWVDNDPLLGENFVARQLHLLWDEGDMSKQVAQFTTSLCTRPIAIIMLAVGVMVLLHNVGWWTAVGLLLAATGVIAGDVLKEMLGPTATELQRLGPAAPGNFPSGHTVWATTVFGYLAVVGWRYGRREVTAIMVGLIVLMGPALVMTQAHLPSDILAGYAFGGAWLCLTFVVIDAIRRDSAR